MASSGRMLTLCGSGTCPCILYQRTCAKIAVFPHAWLSTWRICVADFWFGCECGAVQGSCKLPRYPRAAQRRHQKGSNAVLTWGVGRGRLSRTPPGRSSQRTLRSARSQTAAATGSWAAAGLARCVLHAACTGLRVTSLLDVICQWVLMQRSGDLDMLSHPQVQ